MNADAMKRRVLCPAVLSLLLSLLFAPTAGAQSAETLERLAKEAHAKFKDDAGGKNADYIPALAKVPSKLFGITIVTVDGKVINVGDVDYPFSMQSCSKVFTMCLVMQESGDKEIYEKVSVEPTGEAFNSIRAIEEGDGRADNPFVNPGAIATVSLVKAITRRNAGTRSSAPTTNSRARSSKCWRTSTNPRRIRISAIAASPMSSSTPAISTPSSSNARMSTPANARWA